ncbi:unnamed protein product [Candida verbasci]|uniref:Trafficking protein particle complex subunit n=1 Tax=Candida verbasci TaxID=1227364 RepID=A0A9W4TY89_9ASCO|nr:unnamed protein product [Candida verbasci]
MTIHSFIIFDRHCNCIYKREYSHELNNNPLSGPINKNNDSNSSKLLFGILYSLKTIASKLIPEDNINELRSFNIGDFRIHFWESLSRFKFILITNKEVNIDLQSILFQLYSKYFIKYVVENGLSPIEFKYYEKDPKENEVSAKINNGKFIEETDKYLQTLSIF